MPCTSPLPAWRPVGSGGRPAIFTAKNRDQVHSEFRAFIEGYSVPLEAFWLDCGGCLSCRIAKQRDLAIRAMAESALHPENHAWFLTLTYNDAHLPEDRGLHLRDIQLFMKRLRKLVAPAKLKTLYCGEYGETGTLRPHWHIACWGHDFTDRKKWKQTPAKYPGGPRYWLFRSALLEEAWSTLDRSTSPPTRSPIGHAWLGKLTYESAAYVASYTTKKLNGKKADEAYRRTDGERMWRVRPEFSQVSRGGRTGKGLGHGFYEQFFTDLFPKDYWVRAAKGKRPERKLPVPRYFRRLLEEDERGCARMLAAALKKRRIDRTSDIWEDTPELRRARDATIAGERRLYGHPDDDERLDENRRELGDWSAQRAAAGIDDTALPREVAEQRRQRCRMTFDETPSTSRPSSTHGCSSACKTHRPRRLAIWSPR